jgi:hypothetical protein
MKLTVFKNQYGYSTLAKNGEDKMYVSVQFKKGNEPNLEKARIEIKDGFFSMYKNKVGIAFPKLVITDYTIEGEQSNNSFSSDDYVPPFSDNDIPPFSDDLPF